MMYNVTDVLSKPQTKRKEETGLQFENDKSCYGM